MANLHKNIQKTNSNVSDWIKKSEKTEYINKNNKKQKKT